MKLALAATLTLLVCLADWNDTSTGLELSKLPHFPLVKVYSGRLDDGESIRFDGITATARRENFGEVLLRGAGRNGRTWQARMCTLQEVWRGDLDKSGTQDYVFFQGGPYFNGRNTPLYSISILLMDEQGMPVPFFTAVYKGEEGVNHIVDLDRDGRAELIISSYDESTSDPKAGPFGSGYWVNQLYRFRDLRSEEARGQIGGITWPFVHAWTYQGTEKAVGPHTGMKVEPPTIHDHSTAGDRELPGGCKDLNYRVLVYDHAGTREIEFPILYSEKQETLLERLRREGATIRLSGLKRSAGRDACRAHLVWATAAPSR